MPEGKLYSDAKKDVQEDILHQNKLLNNDIHNSAKLKRWHHDHQEIRHMGVDLRVCLTRTFDKNFIGQDCCIHIIPKRCVQKEKTVCSLFTLKMDNE